MTTVLRIEPRWTDLDPAGHVNNTVFLVYAEEARNRFLFSTLPDTCSSIVVVHNTIDYHHPVVQSDVIEVSSAIEAIGTTSFTTINVVATATRRCATVRTVQVVLREDRVPDPGQPANAPLWKNFLSPARLLLLRARPKRGHPLLELRGRE
jgi:acyl-CoA thioester hydrolase